MLLLQARQGSGADGCEQQAERSFRHAIELARQQDARSWELRATMSLARLYQGQGKKSDARQMLGAIYSWFTEGFGSRDLAEAGVLLDALS